MTATHCTVCHRRLSAPDSIERGIGPICAAHWGTPEQSSLVDYDGPYGGGDIRLWRDDNGTAHANVPHALILHSPTGFEWGEESPEMNLDVAIRAEQLEPLRVSLDFTGIGVPPAAIFGSTVDVVEVKRGGASVVPATLTGITETLASGGPAFAIAVPPSDLLTSAATGFPSLVVVRAKLSAAILAEAGTTNIDAVADVLPYNREQLTALLAAMGAHTGETERSAPVGPVRDRLAAAFAGHLGILARHDSLLVLLAIMPYDSPLARSGSGGSGPADLALNILLAVTGEPEWSKELHQRFKEQFLGSVPKDGGRITRAEIDEFLLENA